MTLSRRQFLGTSAAAVLAAGGLARSSVFGANERIRLGVIGLHSRGKYLMERFNRQQGAEVVALCDVDQAVLSDVAAQLSGATGKEPKTFRDLRELVSDDGIDAVVVAAPNHWHVPASVWAVQAGKDVYVEKPMSHTLWEGRQLADIAKSSGRIVQQGTQRRSSPGWQRAIQRIREGVIGDIYMARAICFNQRDSIGDAGPDTPPETLDWTLWQGPAPEAPFSRNYVHYNWHWFWDYGNGELGNNVVHMSDIVNWVMDKGFPVRVHSTGGRFGYQDAAQTPNTQVCTYTFADGSMLVCEVRGRFSNDEAGVRVGTLFYGSGGYAADTTFYDGAGKEIPDAAPPEAGDEVMLHMQNFLNAVRSRNQEDIPAPALDGHIAAGICHLGNIAYQLRRDLQFDPATERFVGDDEANGLLTREYREGFEVKI